MRPPIFFDGMLYNPIRNNSLSIKEKLFKAIKERLPQTIQALLNEKMLDINYQDKQNNNNGFLHFYIIHCFEKSVLDIGILEDLFRKEICIELKNEQGQKAFDIIESKIRANHKNANGFALAFIKTLFSFQPYYNQVEDILRFFKNGVINPLYSSDWDIFLELPNNVLKELVCLSRDNFCNTEKYTSVFEKLISLKERSSNLKRISAKLDSSEYEPIITRAYFADHAVSLTIKNLIAYIKTHDDECFDRSIVKCIERLMNHIASMNEFIKVLKVESLEALTPEEKYFADSLNDEIEYAMGSIPLFAEAVRSAEKDGWKKSIQEGWRKELQQRYDNYKEYDQAKRKPLFVELLEKTKSREALCEK
jgi:hypothetical protein